MPWVRPSSRYELGHFATSPGIARWCGSPMSKSSLADHSDAVAAVTWLLLLTMGASFASGGAAVTAHIRN